MTPDHQFICLPQQWKCNGVEECWPGGIDESDCASKLCYVVSCVMLCLLLCTVGVAGFFVRVDSCMSALAIYHCSSR